MTRLKEGILYNDDDCLTLSGDQVTEGSKCFGVDPDTGFSESQTVRDGILQPGPFQTGPDTMWVGPVGIATLGHHLATELLDSHLHFHVHSEFVDGLSTTDAQVLNAYNYLQNISFQPDDSAMWMGTNYSFQITPGMHTLLDKLSVRTGSTPATKYVRLRVWRGTVPVGRPIFSQKYPASDFAADTEVPLTLRGDLEFDRDTTYYFEYSSSEPFSLRTNAAGTFCWMMVDFSMIREDNLLQTKSWIDGDPWDSGDYFIDSRKIYKTHVTGFQSGTFESNFDKWSELASEKYVEDHIAAIEETDPIFTAWDKSTGISITESQISDLQAYLTSESDPVFLAQKGTPGGVATLDGLGKVPVAQLPSSIMEYHGVWNAVTNTPTLADGTGDNGDVYKCNVPGTQDFGSGDITFNQSDWVIYNGSIWERSPNSDVETDPIFTAWDKSSGISITQSQISDFAFNEGSIPFADIDGKLIEDNVKLHWDGEKLRIGGQAVIEDNLISRQSNGVYVGRTRLSESNWDSSPVVNKWEAKENIRDWEDVAVSDDARYITAVVDGGKIYTSEDYGITWTERESDQAWRKVAMSGTGKYQSACVYGGQLYVSLDYGVTWAPKDSTRNWLSIGVSGDGQYQTAGITDGIYVSDDKGDTWSLVSKTGSMRSVALSSDGQYQAVAAKGEGVYVSSDHGSTFSKRATVWGWIGVDMSDDGQYMTAVAVKPNGRIYRSINYGVDWTQVDDGIGRDYSGISMSSDGEYQTATEENGDTYVSVNFGNFWSKQNADNRDWSGIAMSSDATVQAAVVNAGYIYIYDTNFMTMTKSIGADEWRQVAISADGKHQTAVGESTLINYSSDYGKTWAASGSVTGDWTGVAMSSDGKFQTATVLYNDIYFSSDYGVNWAGVSAGGLSWAGVAMSSDGKFQVAICGGEGSAGYIYISDNYGLIWDQKGESNNWQHVACSSDGKYITVTDSYDNLYQSTDKGETWSRVGPSRYWKGIAMSSDGKYQTAVNYDDDKNISVSSDHGASWSTKGEIGAYISVAMSSDGQYQMVARDTYASGGGEYSLYISDNYGQTWNILYDTRIATWNDIKMSSDGKYIIAANDNGIYTYCFDAVIHGESTFKDLAKYDEDYSDSYTNRSLVDKEYADYGSILSKTSATTGLLEGGEITQTGPATLSWTAGEGLHTDYTDPTNPIVTRVSWDEVTDYTPINVATAGQYIVAYDKTGSVIEFDTVDINARKIRDYVIFGGYATTGSFITLISTSAINIGYDGFFSFKDFMRDVIGPANIEGNTISANGANLKLDNSGGTIFIVGANFRNDKEITDERPISAGAGVYFSRVFREAPPSTKIQTDVPGLVDVVDPTKYDDGSGTLQTITGNKFSVQVIYLTPDGHHVVAFGQEVFTSAANAEEAILTSALSYEEYPLLERFVRRAFVIIQSNETDLTNAQFILEGKFRIGGVTSGAGVKQHSSLQKLEWDVSGHLFENGGSFNIGAYNFIVNSVEIVGTDGVVNKAAVEGSANWDSAYGWGDHALVGYLTTYNETDPVFSAWDKSTGISITMSQISDLSESDPVFSLWDKSTGISITQSQISDLNLTQGSIPFGAADGSLTEDAGLFWDGNLGLGLNNPARMLHMQDRNATFRIDRDTNSPAVQLHRFPTGDFTTPWKGFVFGVNAVGADNGAFFIKDFHQNVSGSGDSRLTIDTDGKIDIPGILQPGSLVVNSVEIVGSDGEVNKAAVEDSGNWDTAYDHSQIAGGDSVHVSTTENSNWDAAYGWGDHAAAGYETDPFDGDIAAIFNSVGVLKIQPDANADVELFGDTDVGDAEVGKILYVRRQAVEGDDYIRFYVNHDATGTISASSNLTAYGEDSVTIHSGTENVIFRVGDDLGAKKAYFKNNSNGIVGSVDSLGNAQFNISLDVPKISNTAGLLKIQPDVQGDVELFGDTDVGNDENSKILKVWRRAPEGNDYIRFYIAANQNAYIHASNDLTLQGQVDFTINSVTGNITLKTGDAAGAKKIYYKDSDGTEIGSIDSNGKSWFADNMGIGKIPATYALEILATDPTVLLENDREIVGTGYNVGGLIFSAGESVHNVVGGLECNATEDWTATSSPTRLDFFTTPVGSVARIFRMTIAQDGYVGIGTTDPKEEFHIKSDHPTIAFEEADAASNEKVWEFGASNEEFTLKTANDSYTGTQTVIKAMNRSGTSIGLVVVPNAKFAVGTENVSGELTVDQSNASGGIPVLTLDQGDADQHFIEFLSGTVYTGKNGQDQYLKVKVASSTRYLRLFN